MCESCSEVRPVDITLRQKKEKEKTENKYKKQIQKTNTQNSMRCDTVGDPCLEEAHAMNAFINTDILLFFAFTSRAKLCEIQVVNI